MKDERMFSLDERAKWDFIQEVERFQQHLRHLEAVGATKAPELYRAASQEHLERVTSIYAQYGQRCAKDNLLMA